MISQVIMKLFMQSNCSNNEFQFYGTTMNQTMDCRTKNFIQTIMLHYAICSKKCHKSLNYTFMVKFQTV